MYHLVESLGREPQTVDVGGRDLPLPCIADDAQGNRVLLLLDPDAPMSDRDQRTVAEAGVSYRLIPVEDVWFASIDGEEWMEFPAPPTFADLFGKTFEPEPEDKPEGTFVHLHTHTHASALDGYGRLDEIIEQVLADGQTALGTADHGNCAIHPEQAKMCAEHGLQAIFGMEAYLVEDRFRRTRVWYTKTDSNGVEWEVDPEGYSEKERQALLTRHSDSKEVMWGYQHITLWAMNDEGLRNLWAMSTEAYRDGLIGREPRLDYDTLRRHSAGVIASTGCLRGPLAVPFLAGDEPQVQHNLARLMDIFEDRFYVEIHTNGLDDQKRVNERAVKAARDYGLPMIACVDAHYARADQAEEHRAWIAMQTNKTLEDETDLFQGNSDYHIMTEAEVREALAYLGEDVVEEAVSGTVALANRCTATIKGETDPPVFTRPSREHPDRESRIKRDEQRLREMCEERWEQVILPSVRLGHYSEEEARERFEMEMTLLILLGFCGYFLLVAEYVNWARSRGYLIGPGRGSGGASLVAWLSGITGLDPIRDRLVLGRFINAGRKSLPDFDVDFPSTAREPVKAHIVERWGEKHTLSIGTVQTVKPKAAMDGALRVLPTDGTVPLPSWAEIQAFKAAVDVSNAAAAGTEVSWEKFATDHEDLIEGMQARYPQLMHLVESFVGRIRHYGKHPAGMVVSPDRDITDLPMRVDEDGNYISQFDFNALEAMGLVKFDILTLRTLDTLQQTIDSIKDSFGVIIDPSAWVEEYNDPQVWEEMAAGNTLGVFQIETTSGRKITQQVQPASVEDLAAAITIVRPGPARSGLTDTYLKRRHGLEKVTYVDDRLQPALEESYGVPIYQEQIMAICVVLAGYTEAEADDVRRILGKKKVDQVVAAGSKFVAAATERGMAQSAAQALWDQMAEFAKYGFNKAHADGYAVLGYWCAWLKIHFPLHYLTSVLSTVKSERIPEFVGEARRMGYEIALPDVNESGVSFTPTDIRVRYGLSSVPGVGVPTAAHIVANRPYTSVEDFRQRAMGTGSPVNAGHLRALVHIGAFDAIIDNRRALDLQLEAEQTGEAVTCIWKDPEGVGPGGLPCTFDWDNEVDPPLQSKGRGKLKVWFPKPPPKKCTRACRNYTAPPPVDPATVEQYTDADLRLIEREVLGVYLSSTPFDRLSDEDKALFHKGSEVNLGETETEYVVAATIESIRTKQDRRGNDMAFVTLNAQDANLDAVVFASVYADVKPHLRADDLVFVTLWKTDRGLQVQEVVSAAADLALA